jgi:hypothetical protein
VTVTGGQVGPDGVTTEASRLQATSTTSKIAQIISLNSGWFHGVEFVVKSESSGWAYLEITGGTTLRAWFNLTTGEVGTVDAGLTASISTTDEAGEPYESGWYALRVSRAAGSGTPAFGLGLANADNSTTTTSGNAMFAARAIIHRGVKRQPYMATTTAAVRGAPYDWTHGSRALLIESASPAVTYYSLYADDMTQAAWAKTNVNVALNAVGPHGEPCSTLTASAANGTVLQSITNATAKHMFAAYVRRKTGSGTIEITVDGGTTWVNVTSQIGAAGGAYKRVWAYKAAANPTIGFRIGTSGDEIEVALALDTNRGFVSSPIPIYGSALTRTSDATSIPATFPTASVMSLFADFHASVDYSEVGYQAIGFGQTSPAYSNTIQSFYNAASARARITSNVVASEGTFNANAWDTTNLSPRFQACLRHKSNGYIVGANRRPLMWNPRPSSVTVDDLRLSGLAPMWLRRLVVVPREVSDNDLPEWHVDTTASDLDANILANGVVRHSTGYLANTRIGYGTKLLETDKHVRFIACGNQRHDTGYDEAPRRGVYRVFDFDKTTHKITDLYGEQIVFEPTRWSTGLGDSQGYCFIKVEQGPHKGRLVVLYCEEIGASGNYNNIDANRSLYVRYSDANGAPGTWSTPVKVFDAVEFNGGAPGAYSAIIPSGDSGTSVQVPAGANGWRLVVAFYSLTREGLIYSDDGGDTWVVGGEVAMTQDSGNIKLSEPTISLWPDNTIIVTYRDDQPPGDALGSTRSWAKSTDMGATLVWQGIIPSPVGASAYPVENALCQCDMAATYGPWGRTIFSAPFDNSGGIKRHDFRVYESVDGDLNFVNLWTPFGFWRYVGYSRIIHLYGNVFAMVFESGKSSNADESCSVMVFRYGDLASNAA